MGRDYNIDWVNVCLVNVIMIDVEQSGLSNLPQDRRWNGQTYPAPIVVALIRRQLRLPHTSEIEPHYLLIQRKSRPYDGQWALVGGKWDFGETLSDAIVREVKEETDLDTAFVAVRGLVSECVLPPQDKQQGAHFLIFVCELTANPGQAREREEGAVGWFSCDQIDSLNESGAIIPSDYAMIHSFAGASETVPHIEAEMHAPIDGGSDDPVQMLRFERIDKRKFNLE